MEYPEEMEDPENAAKISDVYHEKQDRIIKIFFYVFNGVTTTPPTCMNFVEYNSELTDAVEKFFSGEKDLLRMIIRGYTMKIAQHPNSEDFSRVDAMRVNGLLKVVNVLDIAANLVRELERDKSNVAAEFVRVLDNK